MDTADFDYKLPAELIAQQPLPERAASRLLCLDRDSGAFEDCGFSELERLLRPEDLLVVNNTRVMQARVHGSKSTGGKVELLLERVIGERRVLAQLRVSKSPRPGTRLVFGDAGATVVGRHETFFEIELDTPAGEFFKSQGQLPLPPYIDREPAEADASRYQTVYAAVDGAVAAPTAGLHFDHELLARLRTAGINIAEVTLHVGAGTFQPVRAESVADHQMHAEWLQVDDSVCEAVEQTRSRGGRVIAVGTTSVRALETAAASGTLQPFEGDTRLFISPGYRFNVVDALITNFHLPRSSLLMLVCAFAGTRNVLAAYEHAVAERYRFFSYGDAMFISNSTSAALP